MVGMKTEWAEGTLHNLLRLGTDTGEDEKLDRWEMKRWSPVTAGLNSYASGEGFRTREG